MVQKFSISTQAGLALCTYFFLINGLGGSRTHDHRFRKPSLYPTELQSLKVIKGRHAPRDFLRNRLSTDYIITLAYTIVKH